MAYDRNLRNTQFGTSLRLLLANRIDEEQIIFDMLDNQQFTLRINFINTNFNCNLLNILEETGENLDEPTNSLTCIQMKLFKINSFTTSRSDNINEMNFCKWISHENQTIAYKLQLLNTKVINRTANLIHGEPTKSSGIWQPVFISSELSDQYLYNQQGEYHRYLSTETILTIALDENHFYLENSQELVARRTEVNFHTILL